MTSTTNLHTFNTGNVRMYSDPHILSNSGSSRDADHFKYMHNQESTSFAARGQANGAMSNNRLAMTNVNYEQSYPIQSSFKSSDKASKRKASYGEIPLTQPKQTCSTFRQQPTARKSGVIRIDARNFSESTDSDVPSTTVTLPRAMNPLTSYSGTSTTLSQKQTTAPCYIQRNASKTSLYAPSSICHMIATTTPPPPSATVLDDLPPPPPTSNTGTRSSSFERQNAANNFAIHTAYDSTNIGGAGTLRRSQQIVEDEDYPASCADTLLYQTHKKVENKKTVEDHAHNNKSYTTPTSCSTEKDSLPTNGNSQHVTFAPSQFTDPLKTKKSSNTGGNNAKRASTKSKDTAALQYPTKTTKDLNHSSKKRRGVLDRKSLWCMIVMLFLLLFTTVIFMIYFAINYNKLKNDSAEILDTTRTPTKSFATISSPTSENAGILPTSKRNTVLLQTKPLATSSTPTAKSEKYCLTENCVQSSSIVSQKMNKSVDPCVDFYEYSCGGWISNNFIPPDRIKYGVVSKISTTNERRLYEALLRTDDNSELERDIRGKDSLEKLTDAEKKAKIFFKSCINIRRINELGAQPMLDMVSTMGGWEALGNWNQTMWNFGQLLYIVHGEQSLNVFFSMTIQAIGENETRNVFRLDPEGVTIPDPSFYLSQPTAVVPAYKRLVRTILTLLGAKDIDRTVNIIYNFELNLAEIIQRNRDIGGSIITIGELKRLCPAIDWFRLLQRIITKKSLSDGTEIFVSSRKYLSDLSILLRNSNASVLHNYMIWRSVITKANYLSTSFRKAMTEFSSALLGPRIERPLWKDCLRKVHKDFGTATGAMFVRETFPLKSKLNIEKMVRNIKNSFRLNLANVKWMDKKTRNTAMDKLNNMGAEVGYQEKFRNDPDSLNDEYRFDVDLDSYFKNLLNCVRFKISRRVDTFFNSPYKKVFDFSPQTLNAFYAASLNKLFLPAGLLQSPLYDPTFPMALNYGGIGSIIGHEVTHGYDSQGQNFDRSGVYKPWWSPSAYNTYRKRSQCLVSQYSKYSIGELYVDGANTLDENIADIAGLKFSYMAYREWASATENIDNSQMQLPGLELTNNQLFFVAYAQTWCTKRLPDSYRRQFGQEMHAPERFRVLGGVSQYREFSRAFNCPPRSPMNPDRRCLVW